VRKQSLLEEIKTLDGLEEDESQLAEQERDKRHQLKVDLGKVASMQEVRDRNQGQLR
jgi:hypothetical protein